MRGAGGACAPSSTSGSGALQGREPRLRTRPARPSARRRPKPEAERDATDAINAKKPQEMEASSKKIRNFDASEVRHRDTAVEFHLRDAYGL